MALYLLGNLLLRILNSRTLQHLQSRSLGVTWCWAGLEWDLTRRGPESGPPEPGRGPE